jgi:hypothetical protein
MGCAFPNTPEIEQLRNAMLPALNACGCASTNLTDEEFAGRLRRCLANMPRGGGAGFIYTCGQTDAGDYVVSLVWDDAEEKKLPPSTPNGFRGDGPSEVIAFLRAAERVFHHQHFRMLMARGAEL